MYPVKCVEKTVIINILMIFFTELVLIMKIIHKYSGSTDFISTNHTFNHTILSE